MKNGKRKNRVRKHEDFSGNFKDDAKSIYNRIFSNKESVLTDAENYIFQYSIDMIRLEIDRIWNEHGLTITNDFSGQVENFIVEGVYYGYYEYLVEVKRIYKTNGIIFS